MGELKAARSARGLPDPPSNGCTDPLETALYIENISFRRPWSLISAYTSFDFGVNRNFPVTWSGVVFVIFAYCAWQYTNFYLVVKGSV